MCTVIFDSRSEEYKKPFGCLSPGQKCRLRVIAERKIAAAREETYAENAAFCFEFTPEETGLYFYSFLINGKRLGRGKFNRPSFDAPEKWSVLCCREDKPVSESFRGRVMYQIFPDRFCKCGDCDTSGKLTPFFMHTDTRDIPEYRYDGERQNNDFYGGNFSGIIQRLGYLKSLGVGIIYLNPIFKAFSNHRYDTADYMKIDPLLGTEEDFIRLADEIHGCGMKLILDGVFSHTGADSVYFDIKGRGSEGAYAGEGSPYRSWYSFNENGYDCWWGIKTLPCVNEMDESYLDFILTGENSVVRRWLRLGADGYRLDVADELPDEFLKIFRRTVREEKPDSLIIGEVWEDASLKISYGRRRGYLLGDELDGVMNYVYKNAIIDFVCGKTDAEELCESVMSIAENYPASALHSSMVMLSTHDTYRILTALGAPGGDALTRDERAVYKMTAAELALAKKRLKAAVYLLFTLPGSPSIYYGDEAGMQGYEDPFNRGFFNWEETDGEIFEYYRGMAELKNSSPALRLGDIKPISAGKDGFVFERSYKGEKAVCSTCESEQEKLFHKIMQTRKNAAELYQKKSCKAP